MPTTNPDKDRRAAEEYFRAGLGGIWAARGEHAANAKEAETPRITATESSPLGPKIREQLQLLRTPLSAAVEKVPRDLRPALADRLVERVCVVLLQHVQLGAVTATPTGDGTCCLQIGIGLSNEFGAAALRACEDELSKVDDASR
jgi:hypothetical protein